MYISIQFNLLHQLRIKCPHLLLFFQLVTHPPTCQYWLKVCYLILQDMTLVTSSKGAGGEEAESCWQDPSFFHIKQRTEAGPSTSHSFRCCCGPQGPHSWTDGACVLSQDCTCRCCPLHRAALWAGASLCFPYFCSATVLQSLSPGQPALLGLEKHPASATDSAGPVFPHQPSDPVYS